MSPPNLSKDAEFIANSNLIAKVLNQPDVTPSWKPKVNAERMRGVAADVYPKVAPAVVVVRTSAGYGTGFVLHSEGWILTNYHVIARAAVDATGAQVANIHFGKLQDGIMQLTEESVPAYVHKFSEEKDGVPQE